MARDKFSRQDGALRLRTQMAPTESGLDKEHSAQENTGSLPYSDSSFAMISRKVLAASVRRAHAARPTSTASL
jgi:hypothetical protein